MKICKFVDKIVDWINNHPLEIISIIIVLIITLKK
jgi:hypothetical protein